VSDIKTATDNLHIDFQGTVTRGSLMRYIQSSVEYGSATADSSPPRCRIPHRDFFYFPSAVLELMYRTAKRCHFLFLFCMKFKVQYCESKKSMECETESEVAGLGTLLLQFFAQSK
jgi:hypothetical protein